MLGGLLNSLRFFGSAFVVVTAVTFGGIVAAVLYGQPYAKLHERRLFRESERCTVLYEGVREFRFFDEQCQLRYKGEWRNADDIEWIERPKWTRP
mgnify:FL=1